MRPVPSVDKVVLKSFYQKIDPGFYLCRIRTFDIQRETVDGAGEAFFDDSNAIFHQAVCPVLRLRAKLIKFAGHQHRGRHGGQCHIMRKKRTDQRIAQLAGIAVAHGGMISRSNCFMGSSFPIVFLYLNPDQKRLQWTAFCKTCHMQRSLQKGVISCAFYEIFLYLMCTFYRFFGDEGRGINYNGQHIDMSRPREVF